MNVADNAADYERRLAKHLAEAAASYDRRADENVTNAEILLRDRGGTDEEVASYAEIMREQNVENRAKYLADLEAWLRRGGETLQ